MNDSGLFAPLWIGSGIMVIAAIISQTYMIEPGDARLEEKIDEKLMLSDDDEHVARPEDIDQKTMWNIVAGAVSLAIVFSCFIFLNWY